MRNQGRTIMRAVAVLAIGVAASCSSDGGAPATDASVSAADVRRCLTERLGEDGWAEVPLSDAGGTAFAVDLDSNVVQIYVEADAARVAEEAASIRAAEDAFGATAPAQRSVLRERGNVLLAWYREPTEEHAAIPRACVGFA